MKKMQNSRKKQLRTFSTTFKREKVLLIEDGQITVLQLSRIYDVSSRSVYNWIKKYGKYESTERMVVEKKSESMKNIELLKKIESLERIIGKQQVKLLYKEKVIELGSELLGKDIEKKYSMQPSQGL